MSPPPRCWHDKHSSPCLAFLYVNSGDQTQVLRIEWQAFYQLIISSAIQCCRILVHTAAPSPWTVGWWTEEKGTDGQPVEHVPCSLSLLPGQAQVNSILPPSSCHPWVPVTYGLCKPRDCELKRILPEGCFSWIFGSRLPLQLRGIVSPVYTIRTAEQ